MPHLSASWMPLVVLIQDQGQRSGHDLAMWRRMQGNLAPWGKWGMAWPHRTKRVWLVPAGERLCPGPNSAPQVKREHSLAPILAPNEGARGKGQGSSSDPKAGQRVWPGCTGLGVWEFAEGRVTVLMVTTLLPSSFPPPGQSRNTDAMALAGVWRTRVVKQQLCAKNKKSSKLFMQFWQLYAQMAKQAKDRNRVMVLIVPGIIFETH